MTLSDLGGYNPITIQCHDNPDADSIGAGFALYRYFESLGKDVSFIYGGRFEIAKTNLLLLIEECDIPINYVDIPSTKFNGLLITVDCQWGGNNVTPMYADEYAVIDHHTVSVALPKLSEIREELGSACTLVWKLMNDAGYDINRDKDLCTALFYGLYSDTNQLAELYTPLDRDVRDTLRYSRSLINRLKNSNLSLSDLETVGVAMLRNKHNAAHRYSVMQVEKCDPNILGLISDFLMQVDTINTCVVYSKLDDGMKLSVRNCDGKVDADELVKFLCEGIGSGGGHKDKAGGFISGKLYEKAKLPSNPETYFAERMDAFLER